MATSIVSSSNGQITCKVPHCGWSGHVIVGHLKEKHDLQPGQYLANFKDAGAVLASSRGLEAVKERFGRTNVLVAPKRETEEIDVISTFGFPEKMRPKDGSPLTTTRYATPTEHTPRPQERYVFPVGPTRDLIVAMERTEDNHAWIWGMPGVGKTQLARNMCARLNHEVFEIQGTASLTPDQLLGGWVTRPRGGMVFQYGILPMALARGATLLVDEIDTLNPYTLAILRPCLSDDPKVVLMENGAEVIRAAPGFRVIATSNTRGAGDDTGMYNTAQVMPEPDRQRFALKIKMDYLTPEQLKEILKHRFEKIADLEIDRFLKVEQAMREQFIAKSLSTCLSPRQLIRWADLYATYGDVNDAAQVSLLNGMADHEAVAVSEIIKATWS